MRSSRGVVGLFGELCGTGGVQEAGRVGAAALCRLAADHGLRSEIVALNDGPGRIPMRVDGWEYQVRGFGRRRAMLTQYLLRAVQDGDRLYIGHPRLAPLGLVLRLLKPTVRYWVVAHGVETWQPLPPVIRLALRRSNGVVAVSRHTACAVIRVQGVNAARVVVVPNAVVGCDEVAAPPAQSQTPSDGRLILAVGRLVRGEPGKGIDLVIQAMPEIVRRTPGTRYVVVGDGDDRPRLEHLAQQVGMQNQVVFEGRVSTARLREIYRQADVFVMPSRQEGFGIAFAEAMAFGIPVVAAAYGGTVDVIRDGETGFLIEYGDLPALTDRVTALLADEGLRLRMGREGRRHVEARFTVDKLQARLASILETGEK